MKLLTQKGRLLEQGRLLRKKQIRGGALIEYSTQHFTL